MKAGIYGRVSTLGKGQDVDLQLRDLRNYAQARGWKIFKEYIDNGVLMSTSGPFKESLAMRTGRRQKSTFIRSENQNEKRWPFLKKSHTTLTQKQKRS